MERDRNLLFGIFAVQIKGVAPKQIIEAGAAWATDTSKPISARLVEIGALSDADVALIDQLVNAAIAAHSGDASSALISLGGEEQVDKTFHGSIIMRPSGGLDTRPMTTDSFLGEPVAVLSTVEEYPGRYSHISEYGRGGMGRVLLVHDEHMGRDVALKELLMPKSEWPGPGDSPAQGSAAVTARFLQEARLTGKLEHPAIVPVYELGRRKNGTLYYTMKLVRGKTLSKALRECHSLQDRLALLGNFVDLCQAIAYAHSRGVIHRDIKPANVMVGAFDETVVLDWGLAKGRDVPDIYGKELESTIRNLQLKVKDRPKPDATPFETRVGEAVGTPHYMSPEQAEGRIQDITERSDIYSLGVVLYELLTGKVPFDGPSIDEIFWRLLNDAPPDVEKVEPNAPAELIEVCKKAMAKSPEKRYESAAALAEEIKRFMSGSFVQAFKYTPAQVFVRYYRQNRLIANTVAAGVIALISLGIFSYINILQARNNERDQRVIAEAAKVTAETAKATAETARDAEAAARSEAESQQYVAQLRLAQSYIEDQQMPLANTALDKAPAQLRDWVWGYLKGQANQAKFRIYSEKSVIFWAKFDPTGKFIVALRNPEPPGMWDAETGAHIRDFEGAEALYNNASFNADGSRFAAIGVDGLDVWDTATGKQLHHLAHTTMGYDLAFPPDAATVWGSYEDGLLIEWDLATGQPDRTLNTESKDIGTLRIADGTLLAAANEGGVQAWSLATGTRLYALPGTGIWPAPDGKTFLAGNGPTLSLHVTQSGLVRQRLEGHTQRILHAAFSKDLRSIVICDSDSTVRVWQLESEARIQYSLSLAGATGAFFTDNDTRIIVCQGANTFRVLKANSGAEMYKFAGSNNALASSDLSPDGNSLVSAMAYRTVEVFDARRPGKLEKLWSELPNTEESMITRLEIAQNPKSLVARTANGALLKFDLANWARFESEVILDENSDFALSGNGDYLAFVSNSRVVVQDFGDDSTIFSPDVTGLSIKSLALNHDASRLAVTDQRGNILAWELPSGTRSEKNFGTSPIYGLSWLQDGESLVAGTSDGDLLVLDYQLNELSRKVGAHVTTLIDVATDARMRSVASVSLDGVTVIWNVIESGHKLEKRTQFYNELPYIRPESKPISLDFVGEGNYLLSRNMFGKTLLVGMKENDVLLTLQPDWTVFPAHNQATGIAISHLGSINLLEFTH